MAITLGLVVLLQMIMMVIMFNMLMVQHVLCFLLTLKSVIVFMILSLLHNNDNIYFAKCNCVVKYCLEMLMSTNSTFDHILD